MPFKNDQPTKDTLWSGGYLKLDENDIEWQVFGGSLHFLNIYLLAPFVYKTIGNQTWEYNSIVQGYYHQRALFAKDYYSAAKIASLRHTKQSTRIYGKVQVSHSSLAWSKEKDHIMYLLVLASYSQTDYLRRRLLSTRESKLVYISKEDVNEKHWSCGLTYSNPDVRVPDKWTGRNSLGTILMNVRTKIALT